MRPLPRQELLLFTALNPEPGSPYGVSLLRSMPFLADILLKIYRTIGKNWERAGNVRYAVVCRPGGDGRFAPSLVSLLSDKTEAKNSVISIFNKLLEN